MLRDLVERDNEYSVLTGMVDACASGAGGVVLISGPAASGKTALLHRLAAYAATVDAQVLSAAAAAGESEMPLGVFEQLLLDANLSAPPNPADPRPAEDGVKSVLPRLVRILLSRARKQPLVVIVDDVHHADRGSLDGVLYLIRRLESGGVLVVLTQSTSHLGDRPGLRAELPHRPDFRLLRLAMLTPCGVARMAAAAIPERRARPDAAELYRLSGGNPLLVRALLDEALDGRTGGAAGDAYRQAVTVCLHRCDPALRRTAEAVAVLGGRAGRAEVAEVLGITPEAAESRLAGLAEMGLVGPGGLRHPAAREAVLRGLDPDRRVLLETRAVRVLHERGAPSTVLAPHLLVAEDVDASWAVPALLEAAERALAAGDAALALEYLRTARDAGPGPVTADAIKAATLRASWRADPGSVSRQLPELTAAALAGRLPPGDAVALTGYLLWFGQVEQALAVLDVAQRRPAGRPGPVPADVVRPWASCGFPGLAPDGRGAAEDGSDDRPPPGAGCARRAAALARAVLGGAPDEEVAVRAERILQSARLPDGELMAIITALVSLALADRLDRAAFWCGTLARTAAGHGVAIWQALITAVGAFVDMRRGRPAEAQERAAAALALVPPEGWGVAVALPLAVLLYTGGVSGRPGQAARYLAVRVPDAAFDTVAGLLYVWARGHHHAAAGRPYAALDDFHAVGDLMARWGVDLPALVPWRTDAARVHLSLGNRRRARDLAQEQLARVGPAPTGTRGVTLRVLAAALSPRYRLGPLEEAVMILEERGDRLEYARALEDLGRARRDLGDESAGRGLSRRARRLMHEIGGAAADGAAGAPAGAMPVPRDGARNPAGLSDAELRVAALAARGHTNRQIAARLYITTSTVEQHLTRVYRKLDVRRRSELPARLDSAAGVP